MANQIESGCFRRVVLLLVEGLGMGGELGSPPHGDGAHSLRHLSAYVGGVRMPFMQWLGLGNLVDVRGVPAVEPPAASLAVMGRRASGAGSADGIREMFGSSLAAMVAQGIDVHAYGSVAHLFDDNEASVRDEDLPIQHMGARLTEAASGLARGLILAGVHLPRDRGPVACARALEQLDSQIPLILDALDDSGLLLVSGTTGADPVMFAQEGFTREDVPLLAYTPAVASGVQLGRASSVASVGATIAENFGVGGPVDCPSFYEPLLA